LQQSCLSDSGAADILPSGVPESELRQEHQVRKRGDVIALDVGRKVRKTKKAARASLQKLLREGYAKISCFHLLLLAPSRSMFPTTASASKGGDELPRHEGQTFSWAMTVDETKVSRACSRNSDALNS